MTLVPKTRTLFLATTALASMAATSAAAQSASATQQTDPGDIVVTATRQSVSINSVPISVSAVTQESIDRQGIKNVQDLSRLVPGVSFRNTGGDRVAQIAVRGIAATGGSQTTGVYLDDTPLQKRGILGSPVTGSGSPLPSLFDLERVEVLKGPQGTLYGGSSEGGTIRFITPTPSLTKYSGLLRAEVSSLHEGGVGHDLGIAIGGPIIKDKLGFRVSFRQQRIAGYIDEVSRFDGHVVNPNTNYTDSKAFRLAVLFKPTERFQITPSVYITADHSGDLDNFWYNIPTATTVAARSFTAAGVATTNPALIAYTHPAHTYGPYNVFGPYRNGQVTNVGDNYQGQIPLAGLPSPNRRNLSILSNNAQYDFGAFKANLITSYTVDKSRGSSDLSFQETRTFSGYPFVFDLPVFYTRIDYENRRTSDNEELRFTSNAKGRFTWVAGLYHARAKVRSYAPSYWNYNGLAMVARGISDTQLFGTPLLDSSTGLTGVRDQTVTDTEFAAYGDATFAVTDRFKITAGVRYSKVEVAYSSLNYGQAVGFAVPTVANNGIVTGKTTERPVTPKFGASYQFDPTAMIYANAAKGYRPGGVNLPASASLCGADFTALGITATPLSYSSDSVWSYEAGFKKKLFGRAQVNAAAFYIDWQSPQTSVTLPSCGNAYLINAGKAVSKGFDAQITTRIIGGLSLSGSVAYTDAQQQQSVGLSTPTNPTFVMKGDRLPVPKWSYSVSAQYDYKLFGGVPAFIRMDYQYASRYQRSAGPGTTTYAPDTYMADATHIASLRTGFTVQRLETSFFINNLFESRDILNLSGGRSGCSTPACTTYGSYAPIFVASTFRPREFGVTTSYKF